jgi:hypothetical protein
MNTWGVERDTDPIDIHLCERGEIDRYEHLESVERHRSYRYTSVMTLACGKDL